MRCRGNGICSVIFDEESRAIQEKLTISVTNQIPSLENVQKTLIEIDHEKDIKKIPRCAVYLVYVSKHPRNIILEHPDKDQDYLRSSIVEALIKRGGKSLV